MAKPRQTEGELVPGVPKRTALKFLYGQTRAFAPMSRTADEREEPFSDASVCIYCRDRAAFLEGSASR